jgi:hypothetical protein
MTYSSTLKTEAVFYYEWSVDFYWPTQLYVSDDRTVVTAAVETSCYLHSPEAFLKLSTPLGRGGL